MALVTDILTVISATAAIVLLLMTSLLYVPFRWRPVGLYLIAPKVFAVAFAPLIALAAAALAVVGVLVGSWWVGAPAVVAAVGAIVVTLRVGAAAGTDVVTLRAPRPQGGIPEHQRRRMVGRWWRGRIPRDPEPRLRSDVLFATIPDTDRVLLCDVWEPPVGVPQSGVAVVYLHGSAYYILDKDVGTRPVFRHLATQGHVVVDVAYRLFPETDVPGMVADAERAVAWVRDNAGELGVDPHRIVLAAARPVGTSPCWPPTPTTTRR